MLVFGHDVFFGGVQLTRARMRVNFVRRRIRLLLLLIAVSPLLLAQENPMADKSLVGLWGTEQSFDPQVRGVLTIDGRKTRWRARIAGFDVPTDRHGDQITFSLPGSAGEFRGRLDLAAGVIHGEWIQPAGVINTIRYATPVQLARLKESVWRGVIVPLEDRISFYVSIQRHASGSSTAAIINPEYNLFRRRSYDVAINGPAVTFTNPKRTEDHFEGVYDKTSDRLSLPLLNSYPPLPLTRRDHSGALGFYSRTPASSPHEYTKPVAENDGWPTASLAEVGLAEQPLAALVEKILTADPTDNPLNIDSLLIARHGKLVFEEYFHGYDEERAHDMRSASKTFAPVMVGIARDKGINIGPDTAVFPLFGENKSSAHWDARKTQVTLKTLMTMTSGLACNDNDDTSPGNEDNMQNQDAQPDWYKYTLDLPMIADPGGKHAVYCSAGINLVGGVVSHAAHSPLPEFFDDHVARPLQFHTHHMNLMPTGEGYMGGGLYLRPRDELKLGQLYLSDGIWGQRRIISRDWIRQSTTAYTRFDPQTDYDAPHDYGFGWHINQVRVGSRIFRTYSAGGNGGQIVMVVPDLDLVVGFNGGSYGEFGKWYRWGLQLVPQYIIPAALGQNITESKP